MSTAEGKRERNGEWSCEYNTQVPIAYQLSLPKTVYLLNYLPLFLLPLFSPLFKPYFLPPVPNLLPIYLLPRPQPAWQPVECLTCQQAFGAIILRLWSYVFMMMHLLTPPHIVAHPTLPYPLPYPYLPLFILGRLRGCVTRNCVAFSRDDQFLLFFFL